MILTNAICWPRVGWASRMQFDRLKRREFITLLGGAAAAWPLAAHAQQGERMRRVGWLTSLLGHRALYLGSLALFCSTSVLSGLADAKKSMSELIKPARRYVQSGEINFETEDKEAALDDLKRAYPKAKIDELDGVTVDAGSWWCNVRPSNTEPLLRLNLEGPDKKTVDKLVTELSQYLGRRVAH